MNVFKYEISDVIIDSALDKLGESFDAIELRRELEKLDVPVYIGCDYISTVAASRIIQKLKRKNKIKNIYGGGANTIWEWDKKSSLK